MKMTVSETAKLCGITARTLHYYDQIGLLIPGETTEAGYRLYHEQDLLRLEQILFFRELDFPLSRIKQILESPAFNRGEALLHQKDMLILKQKRLDRLIHLIDTHLKGEQTMSFEAFDMNEIEAAQEKYSKEAEERWGHTDAYKESTRRTASYTKEDWARISEESNAIYDAFINAMEEGAESPAAMEAVKRWQDHISRNFYPCSKEILAGLGEMYTADVRFTESIDKFKAGLAAFMSAAIAYYCQQ